MKQDNENVIEFPLKKTGHQGTPLIDAYNSVVDLHMQVSFLMNYAHELHEELEIVNHRLEQQLRLIQFLCVKNDITD